MDIIIHSNKHANYILSSKYSPGIYKTNPSKVTIKQEPHTIYALNTVEGLSYLDSIKLNTRFNYIDPITKYSFYSKNVTFKERIIANGKIIKLIATVNPPWP